MGMGEEIGGREKSEVKINKNKGSERDTCLSCKEIY